MEDNKFTGCVMLSIPMMNEVIEKLQKEIKKVMVRNGYRENEDYEFETYPHITVAFGINVDTDTNVIKEIVGNRPSYFQITELSLFDNENFDIIKFDIMSADLRILNQIIKSKMEVKSDYPGYHPHLTVAYVPKGLGVEIITLLNHLLYVEWKYHFEPLTHSNEYTYSTSMEGERAIL